MKWYWGVPLVIMLTALACFVSRLVSFNVTIPMVLLTALWASVDSQKLELKKYKSGVSYGPVALFFAIAFLWIFGFPWYLEMRHRIKHGQAKLKEQDNSEPSDAPRQ
jgi:hypothetical protein